MRVDWRLAKRISAFALVNRHCGGWPMSLWGPWFKVGVGGEAGERLWPCCTKYSRKFNQCWVSLVLAAPNRQATPVPRSHTHARVHNLICFIQTLLGISPMIEQEPQSDDMCDCILERIGILLSARGMHVGLGVFLARMPWTKSWRSAVLSVWHHLF